MTAGGVRRRCRCRDENGKDLGASCPKLKQRNHGAWQVRQELVRNLDETRNIFRRNGYDTKDEAQGVLDRVRELLNLAEDDQDATADGRAVTAMLMGLEPGEPLPDPEVVRRQLRAGLALNNKGTLGDWLTTWLGNQGHLRRSSLVRYRGDVENHIRPHIGHLRLDRLTVGHVRELFAKIEDANDAIRAANADRKAMELRVQETSVRAEKRALREQMTAMPPYRRVTGLSSQVRVRACLRKALNDAIAEQSATFNPAQHVTISAKRPRPLVWTAERVDEWRETGQRPGTVMVWLPEHAGQFLDHVAEHAPHLAALFHVAVFRGPRRGELCGLGWTEVDLDEATIQITRQITEIEFGVLEEDAPKSAAGERTVPVDAEGVRLLRSHRRWQRERKLELGGAWVDSGKVFTQSDGSPVRPSWLGDEFVRLYTAADLPPVRLHDLRHLAATLMLLAGIDMKVVQETLGHSALAVTSDTYTSVLPQLAKSAAEAVTEMVPRAARGAPAQTPGHPRGTQEINLAAVAGGGEPTKNETPQLDRGLSAV
jgi:integrase